MTLETLQITPAGKKKKSYLQRGIISNFLRSTWVCTVYTNSNVCESNALVKTGPLQHPTLVGKQGNISQLGGDFILGPGNVCSFAHRMQNTEDRTFLSYLFNIIYSEVKIPQMLKWLISCRLLEWLILELLVLVGTSPSFSNKCFKWTNNVRHNHNAQLQRPSEFESSESNARYRYENSAVARETSTYFNHAKLPHCWGTAKKCEISYMQSVPILVIYKLQHWKKKPSNLEPGPSPPGSQHSGTSCRT